MRWVRNATLAGDPGRATPLRIHNDGLDNGNTVLFWEESAFYTAGNWGPEECVDSPSPSFTGNDKVQEHAGSGGSRGGLAEASKLRTHQLATNERDFSARTVTVQTFNGTSTGRFGRRNSNVAPVDPSLVTEISPPCASTIDLQIARPSPVPPSSRERALSIR